MATKEPGKNNDFSRQVGQQEQRRMKALHGEKKSIWAGLGLFGMVGWSVAIPTLAGAALGLWLDKKHPQSFSWTITLLVTGLLAGCLIAWNWVRTEHREMHQNTEDNHDEFS